MASGKQRTPPPIDKPIQKAYLRGFKGWSTAYPPGMSDPTSLRVMHNTYMDADDSLRIRPGTKGVFNAADQDALPGGIVGSFEHFYDSEGNKCLLFAVRDTGLEFRVAVWNETSHEFDLVDLAGAGFTVTGTPGFSADCTYVKYLQINNYILALPESSNPDDKWVLFDVGGTYTAKALSAIGRPNYDTTDAPVVTVGPDDAWYVSGTEIDYDDRDDAPAQRTLSGTTLESSTPGDNIYYYGFFYTFANEIGESSPSIVTTVAAQRRWTAWEYTVAAGATAGRTYNAQDLIHVAIPSAVWTAARAAGAVEARVYVMTWSDQEPYPVEGQLFATKAITADGGQENWVAMHPGTAINGGLLSVPNGDEVDYSAAYGMANGIVAADRMVVVYNRSEVAEAARIRWSGNQQGEYINFSPAVGGGFKSLTSGNLYAPACVKLWQNPQSVDTLTVLCAGIDGEGTAYYMAPNSQITTQSQMITVMGFEETTATPGTVSPFGCEVLNNALYHPLDNNIMKSTAMNYNINHSTIADAIQNVWRQIPLSDKRKVVSSQMDNLLYFLVRSPAQVSWSDDTTSNGNQIWVCNTKEQNTWAVFDIPGTSLRKLEVDGLLYMAVTSGSGIYILDPEKDTDDVLVVTEEVAAWEQVGIAWEIETNTQGANRQHDAWAWLQQVNVTFGNFTGECEYGIRGVDVYGQPVEVTKKFVSPQVVSHDPLERYDQGDFLQIGKTLKEWRFFWKSLPTPKRKSYGSLCFVQYTFTPASVNVDYALGSVETFEYGSNPGPAFSNGTPVPFADTRIP